MAGRILIADPVPINRILLKVGLSSARYEILPATDGKSALEIARSERPDLVIVNARLPDGTGAWLCETLKRDPVTRAIPVLVVDAKGSRARRLAALTAGADDYLSKPIEDSTLLALVRNLMRTRATFDELARRQDTGETMGFGEAGTRFARAARVALIAPTPETAQAWRKALRPVLSAQVVGLTSSQALDRFAHNDIPDAFVIAADLSAPGDGLRLVSELRARASSRYAAIVVHDDAGDIAAVPMALDLGANAVLSGRFDAEELAARLDVLLARKLETDALRRSFDERLDLAALDPLTGLYNRRYAEAYLARVADEAARTGLPFAVMLLDLDRFKQVNDTYGHRAGDEVLSETARRLAANVREIDLVARYGGEEFLVAMPETDLTAARAAAERLRRVIGAEPMPAPSAGVDIAVTVSIGVALHTGRDDPQRIPATIGEADAALYASKNEGRNLVTFAGSKGAAA